MNADFSAMLLIILKAICVECEETILIGCIESAGYSNRFDYMDSIQDLQDKKLIEIIKKNNKNYCLLTPAGEAVCNEIEDLYLSKSYKRRALDAAVQFFDTATTGISYITELLQDGDDRKIHFVVEKHHKTIVEASITLTDKNSADTALEYCRTHKELVFNNLSAVLTGELDIFSL